MMEFLSTSELLSVEACVAEIPSKEPGNDDIQYVACSNHESTNDGLHAGSRAEGEDRSDFNDMFGHHQTRLQTLVSGLLNKSFTSHNRGSETIAPAQRIKDKCLQQKAMNFAACILNCSAFLQSLHHRHATHIWRNVLGCQQYHFFTKIAIR